MCDLTQCQMYELCLHLTVSPYHPTYVKKHLPMSFHLVKEGRKKQGGSISTWNANGEHYSNRRA